MSNTKPDPVGLDFSDVTWEFGVIGDLAAVRDSKRPEQTPLVYTRDEIAAMLAGAKAGAFDHLI